MSSKFFKEKSLLAFGLRHICKNVHKSKIYVELIEVIVDYEVLVD